MNKKIDFFIGSKLGDWALENVNPDLMASIKSMNKSQCSKATEMGITTVDSQYSNIAISIHWPQILPLEVINRYEYFLNIHPGIIPQSRGMYPIFWNTFLGEPAGATCHQITSEVDFGPIFQIIRVPTTLEENAGEIWIKVFEAEKILLSNLIEELSSGRKLKFSDPTGVIGPVRTKKDFFEMRDNPALESLSQYQLKRLMLAVKHADFKLPDWIHQMSTGH